jgi:glycosyltransferase involved in cell wall biosynthesis
MVLYGQAGYLAKPGDQHDLAYKIIQALTSNNQAKIEKMYRNVVENYNAEINACRILELYDQILSV